MVSARLVHQIEDHWETISSRLVKRVHETQELTHLKQWPDSEVRESARRILQNLGHWLISSGIHELSDRYQHIGRQKCEEGFPCCEAVRAFQLMREETLSYIRDQGYLSTSVDLYAEEELAHQLGRFFDLLQYYIVMGYEARLREPVKRRAVGAL